MRMKEAMSLRRRASSFFRVFGPLAVVTVMSVVGCEDTNPFLGFYASFGQNYKGVGNVVAPATSTTSGGSQLRSHHGIHASAASSPSTGYHIALLRQSDCSLTEYLTGQTTATSGTVAFSTVPNFQATLHTAAGLTTKAGVWPKGCKDQELGIASRSGADLGPTKDGTSRIGAYIDFNNNLYAGPANLTSGTYAMTELLTGTAFSLLAADVNGDGYPDLLVQNSPSGSASDWPITVYLSNGDGTFTVGATLLSGTATEAFTADDINGDGKIDLVAATANQVLVLPGNGDGTFGAAVPTTTTQSTQYPYVVTGDFNGDGKKDLVLGNGVVLLGDGSGHFTAAPSSSIAVAGPPVVGDWNNDGKQDLAFESTGTGGGILTTYLGNGDGTFTLGNSYATIAGATFLSASDLDGDGNVDLYVGQANGGVYGPDYNSDGVFQTVMGEGNGNFADAQAYPDGGEKTGSAPDAFATADYHGKGYQDVLMLSDAGLEMLTNNGQGMFTEAAVLPGTVPTAVVSADMNGDGKNDAVFAEGSSGSYDIAVALGNGDGTFQTKTTTTVPVLPNHLVIGDFNGDGKPDVVMSSSGSAAVYLLLNNGTGTLGAPTLVSTEANPVTGIVAADLRSDGKLDLVLTEATLANATGAGAVGVLLGNGNGTFQPEVDTTINVLPLAIAVGDMNKDGKPDLVVASSDLGEADTSLYVLPGHGDGTFGTAVSSALTYSYVTGLAVADLNGDGNLDVLISSCCGATFTSIAQGKGDGTFASIGALPLAGFSYSVGAVDLNGDGTPDLLINTNAVGSYLVVMLSQASPITTIVTTKLTSSASTITAATSVTFTATVTASSGTPTGTVTFLDGSSTLGTGSLVSGVATFSTSALAAGTHSITASYGGDASHPASISSVLTETVQAAASFAVSVNPSSLTIGQTGSGKVTVTATPSGGFTQQISFGCSGLPANTTCSFSPASVTPSGAAATTTLTITTGVSASAAALAPNMGVGSGLASVFGSALLLLPWGLAAGRRGRQWNTLHSLVALTIVAGGVLVLSSCGDGSGSGSGSGQSTLSTPAGTSTVTVTATAGTTTEKTALQLTVN
jgi:Bacterial Ig-like domain (group 3)/FG-GAP-like repeat